MNMSVDVHVKSKDIVTVGEGGGCTSSVYVSVEGDGTFTMYFSNTDAVRAFLAKTLNELHKVEAGDIPFSTRRDRIDVKEYDVLSSYVDKGVEVTA